MGSQQSYTFAVEASGLVGRTTELALVDSVLQRARAGEAGAVAVTGEPGVGKSALLREVAARAELGEMTVVHACAVEMEQDVAFGVVIDALDELVGEHSDALPRHRLNELAGVFPSLSHVAEPAAVDRHRLHFAIRVVLEQLAASGPLALIVDDVHWADAASVEVVSRLLRRGLPGGVALVVTYRPQLAPPELSRAVAACRQAGGVPVLELLPLSATDIEALTGLDGTTAHALHRDSGGNPFYATELASQPDPHPSGDVPSAVRDAVGFELDALSPAARARRSGLRGRRGV